MFGSLAFDSLRTSLPSGCLGKTASSILLSWFKFFLCKDFIRKNHEEVWEEEQEGQGKDVGHLGTRLWIPKS